MTGLFYPSFLGANNMWPTNWLSVCIAGSMAPLSNNFWTSTVICWDFVSENLGQCISCLCFGNCNQSICIPLTIANRCGSWVNFCQFDMYIYIMGYSAILEGAPSLGAPIRALDPNLPYLRPYLRLGMRKHTYLVFPPRWLGRPAAAEAPLALELRRPPRPPLVYEEYALVDG